MTPQIDVLLVDSITSRSMPTPSALVGASLRTQACAGIRRPLRALDKATGKVAFCGPDRDARLK
jgi:hypothetical protein